MVSFRSLALLLPLALTLLVTGSPLDDPQVKAFLEEEAQTAPPAKRQARHLRPVYETRVKRNSITPPDVGQIGDFNGSDPAPERGALGDTFLQGSNTVIDEENIDNLAAPTTDAGKFLRLKSRSFLESHFIMIQAWYQT